MVDSGPLPVSVKTPYSQRDVADDGSLHLVEVSKRGAHEMNVAFSWQDLGRNMVK